jgi:hypothetical protein
MTVRLIDVSRRDVLSCNLDTAADLVKYAANCVRFAPSRPELLNAIDALEELLRLLGGPA